MPCGIANQIECKLTVFIRFVNVIRNVICCDASVKWLYNYQNMIVFSFIFMQLLDTVVLQV